MDIMHPHWGSGNYARRSGRRARRKQDLFGPEIASRNILGKVDQADASERIARAGELKAESLKELADYLKRGALEAPAVDPAGEFAVIFEASVEAAVERRSGRQSNQAGSWCYGKSPEGQKNLGIDFKSPVKRRGSKQVHNALPPLKKAGKIKSEANGIYSPA